jgi:hypothetical protein
MFELELEPASDSQTGTSSTATHSGPMVYKEAPSTQVERSTCGASQMIVFLIYGVGKKGEVSINDF